MKVTFFQTGCFEVVRCGIVKDSFESLDAAAEYVWKVFPEGEGEVWEILDLKTGATILRFEDEEDSSDWEPDVDETGFNPYLGDYDFDC